MRYIFREKKYHEEWRRHQKFAIPLCKHCCLCICLPSLCAYNTDTITLAHLVLLSSFKWLLFQQATANNQLSTYKEQCILLSVAGATRTNSFPYYHYHRELHGLVFILFRLFQLRVSAYFNAKRDSCCGIINFFHIENAARLANAMNAFRWQKKEKKKLKWESPA